MNGRTLQPIHLLSAVAVAATGALVVLNVPLAFAALGILVVVGVAAVAASDRREPEGDAEPGEVLEPVDAAGRLPTMWTAFLVTFVVFGIDFAAFLSGRSGLRYALLVVPIAVVALSSHPDRSRRHVCGADIVLAALTVWGLAGAVVGKFVTQPASSSLTIMLPMVIGLVHLWNRGRPTERNCSRMLGYLATIGLAYVMIYLAATLGVGPLSVVAYSKEKAFLLALAPMAAFVARRWWFLTFEVAALIAIFVKEPFATFVVVLAAVALTNAVLSMRSRALKATALTLLVVTVLFGFSLALRPSQDSLVAQYFKAVGKADNTPFRTALFTKGIEEVEKHPVLGTSFTGEIAIQTNFPGVARFAPAHNDFLQLAMAGGLTALALYLVWVGATNRAAQRSYHLLVAREQPEAARLLRVLITGFNAFLFSSLVNPLLAGVGTAVMFFLIYGAMTVLFPDDVHRATRARHAPEPHHAGVLQ